MVPVTEEESVTLTLRDNSCYSLEKKKGKETTAYVIVMGISLFEQF